MTPMQTTVESVSAKSALLVKDSKLHQSARNEEEPRKKLIEIIRYLFVCFLRMFFKKQCPKKVKISEYKDITIEEPIKVTSSA